MSAPFGLAGISLDCDDPDSLARFYLHLLGGRMMWNNATSAGIRIPSGLTLIAQRVEPYVSPTWPGTSIIHFDLAADADLIACQQRAEAAGATLASTARPPVARAPRPGRAPLLHHNMHATVNLLRAPNTSPV